MLDKIKALFDDKESMTLEELEAGVKGMKLVDIKDGGYVATDKFERSEALRQELADKVAQLEKATGGDDELKARIAELEKERDTANDAAEAAKRDATKVARERAVESKIADKRFTRFVLSEAEALCSDTTDFAAALDQWLEDNPDYAPSSDDDEAEPPAKVGTGTSVKGKPKSDNDLFAAIDSVFDGGVKKE